MKQREPVVLVVAGSDSGAGAGLQADLKTCFALGVYATTAVSAITVQNTQRVRAVEVLPGELVAAQMRAVLDDFAVAAVKIGMLGNAEVVAAVAAVLAEYPACPVVLDPVLLSSSGVALLDAGGVALLKRVLLPRVTLVTPNLPEAALLAGMTELCAREQCAEAAAAIRRCGVASVLVKGGHGVGPDAEDLLFAGGELLALSEARVVTPNAHGTGCTLASAIAAGLVRGLDLPAAVAAAKRYLTAALKHGATRSWGAGAGPLGHDCYLGNNLENNA